MASMKVLTWNVNGIRAAKVPLKTLLDSLESDVICFQETKVTRDQLDEASCIVDGYNAYFSFSRKRSGYSGVATFCRNNAAPVAAEEGLTGLLSRKSDNASAIGCYGDTSNFTEQELQSLDAEGRGVMTQHKIRTADGRLLDVVIINVYCPRADRENQERFTYKLRFYELLQLRAEALVQAGRHVIVLGDINVSHRPIDHCDPDVEKLFKLHPSRQWMDKFLYNPETKTDLPSPKQMPTSPTKGEDVPLNGHFVDSFRFFYPDKSNAFTCWNTVTSARQLNYGTWIDYIFADKDLCYKEFVKCDIMPEVEGSDHCPVKAELSVTCEGSSTYPALCTKFMPEFQGKQQKLSSFFQKASPSKGLSAALASSDKNMKKRTNATDASATNKNKKKQKTGPASGNLLNFFQRKTTSTSNSSEKAKDEPAKVELPSDNQETHQNLNASSKSTQGSAVRIADHLDVQARRDNSSQQTDETPSSSQESLTSETSDTKSQPLSGEKPEKKRQLSDGWKSLFKGLPPPPMCKGHKEPCVLRTVKKAGVNRGKRFYVCAKPEGPKTNPESRCDHFEWFKKSSQ